MTLLRDLGARVERYLVRSDSLICRGRLAKAPRSALGMPIAGFLRRMLPHRIEHERPGEFLRWLSEHSEGYRLLLESAGGMAQAAYRLASARCRTQGDVGVLPTLRELQAAAMTIVQALDMVENLPSTSTLANDCEAQGLPVIRPMPPPPSRRMLSPASFRRTS